jgi:hypothetical protein
MCGVSFSQRRHLQRRCIDSVVVQQWRWLGWGAAASARSESMVLGSWEERRGYFSHRQQLQGRLVRGMIGREGVCAAKAKLWLED